MQCKELLAAVLVVGASLTVTGSQSTRRDRSAVRILAEDNVDNGTALQRSHLVLALDTR